MIKDRRNIIAISIIVIVVLFAIITSIILNSTLKNLDDMNDKNDAVKPEASISAFASVPKTFIENLELNIDLNS